MAIHFARFQAHSNRYGGLFAIALVVGGIAAISSNPNGFGVAQLGLAAAFVLLLTWASSRIGDDYREQAFMATELSPDEYMALNARLERYPDLRGKIKALLPESGLVSYEDAYRMETIVNDSVPGRGELENQARSDYRRALYHAVEDDDASQ